MLPPEVLQRVTLLRRSLVQMKPIEAMEIAGQEAGQHPVQRGVPGQDRRYVR